MKKAFVFGVLFLLVSGGKIIFAGPIKVFVSVVPQKYFVQRIGGDQVDVSVMVEPGASPATYEPKPKQMVALAKTKIYYAIGVPFEKAWLEKIADTNPDMLIVHTEAGIAKMPMKANHHHNKGEHTRHHHGIKDPHVWLSPPLVMVQARNILQALRFVDPVHRSFYEAGYKKFITEVLDLDAELRGIFAKTGKDIQFIVLHPAWGYFAHAYGLEQVPIEIQGKEPRPAQFRHLIRHARESGIKVVFVQPQFSTNSAKTMAKAVGGQIAFVDPLALDWTSNLREVAAKFKAVLKRGHQ
jgi:zinc transport system substrate-binding protein